MKRAFVFDDAYIPEPNSGCWLWTRYVNRVDYGIVHRKRLVLILAHRLSYQMHKGSIPAGMQVCHKCDVRSCVNPDHLFLGTHDDNHADKIRKGRQPFGVRNGMAVLDEQSVISIKRSNEVQQVLADRYGVAQTTISFIKRGITWRHL